MKIKGKVAIVTGGAKRVGKAIALALAGRGADVVVHYRSSLKEALETVAEVKSFGVQSFAVRADLASVVQSKKIVSETLKRFKRVDILVNCASVYQKNPLEKITEKDWDSHLEPNLKSAFFLSQAAAQTMLKQKIGKIINIVDSDVGQPYINYLPYLVSKYGMVGLTHCLALELAPTIQVNAVSPGPVILPEKWGPKIRRAIIEATPLRRIGNPQDIANAVLFCVEGTDFMTGAVIPVDGGQHIS